MHSSVNYHFSEPALHWIDGDWFHSENRLNSIDPATGETIGQYAEGGDNEALRAISAALRAFQESSWKHDRALRSRVLNRMADRVEARAEELAQVLALENGKVIAEARMEVAMTPGKFRYFAALALAEHGRAIEPVPGRLSVLLRTPVGVSGIIAPFNSPVVLSARSIAPALAAGTTAVVKMPGRTAQTNHLFARFSPKLRSFRGAS